MERSFSSLEGQVSELTLKAIADMGLKSMTELQARTVELLLKGYDAMVSSISGTGKTLAFLILAVELMYKMKASPKDGTCVIVISPNTELARETYGDLKELLKYHSQSHGLILCGHYRPTEEQQLSSGMNIIIATTGRLLDHLQNTKFLYKNLKCLIIDDVDRFSHSDFIEKMKNIVQILPKTRQTLLCNATLSKRTEDLARIALKDGQFLAFIGIEDNTFHGLKQGYVVCHSEKKIFLLFSFLKKHRHKKRVMVFFNSCESAKFHHELVNHLRVSTSCIHGGMKQNKITQTFQSFCAVTTGILFCSDVAARGLDIPQVDWIVQYELPNDPKEYIHRMDRIARGENQNGNAVLFLQPEEFDFLKYLKRARVSLVEYDFSRYDRVPDFQKIVDGLESFLIFRKITHHWDKFSINICQRSLKGLPLSRLFRLSINMKQFSI